MASEPTRGRWGAGSTAAKRYLEAARAIEAALERRHTIWLDRTASYADEQENDRECSSAFLAAAEVDATAPDPRESAADRVRSVAWLMEGMHYGVQCWDLIHYRNGYPDGVVAQWRGGHFYFTEHGQIIPGPLARQGEPLPERPDLAALAWRTCCRWVRGALAHVTRGAALAQPTSLGAGGDVGGRSWGPSARAPTLL